MKIPHIYSITFRVKSKERQFYQYFGIHRSWDAAWKNIRKHKIEDNKEYITGSLIPWKVVLFIFIPKHTEHEGKQA